MQNTKIIVLLAAHQGANFIEEQLNSIIHQSYKPHKILINYDLSSDNTLDIIKTYKKKYLNIDILETKQKFGSAASNFFHILKTFNFTEFDFISLADQDDIWHKNKLKNAVSKLNKGFDGYSSNVEAFWDYGRNEIIVKDQPQKKYDYLFESAGPGCTYVISKKLIQSLQSFLRIKNITNFTLYHDWIIYSYARSNNFSWFIDNKIGMKYRQHAHNVHGANIGFKAFFSRVKSVLNGDGFKFAFQLIVYLNIKNDLTRSLFPITRISLICLALKAFSCRRRTIDQFYFFIACVFLAIIYPKKISLNKC